MPARRLSPRKYRGQPESAGVLFDLPNVVAAAPPLRAASGVAECCEVVSGSFFDGVPDCAEAYVLGAVIHDWDDARAAAILSNCRRAMTFWISAPAGVAPIASIVVIEDAPTLSMGVMHERVGAPSICTVHAPQSAMPQPNFVPVMPSTSRNTQRSGVSPSTSRLCVLPLTLIAKGMATSEALSQDQDRFAPLRVFAPLTCWLQ
jgi:hypothetical protein